MIISVPLHSVALGRERFVELLALSPQYPAYLSKREVLAEVRRAIVEHTCDLALPKYRTVDPERTQWAEDMTAEWFDRSLDRRLKSV